MATHSIFQNTISGHPKAFRAGSTHHFSPLAHSTLEGGSSSDGLVSTSDFVLPIPKSGSKLLGEKAVGALFAPPSHLVPSIPEGGFISEGLVPT